VKSFNHFSGDFLHSDIRGIDLGKKFDLIVCSQLLHFADNEEDFFQMWSSIVNHLKDESVVFITMDSVINSDFGKTLPSGLTEFPDGKVRFALTEVIYEKMLRGFKNIEPLKTVSNHNRRAQSIMLLRKQAD